MNDKTNINNRFKEYLTSEEKLSDCIAKAEKKKIHIQHPGTKYLYRKVVDSVEKYVPQNLNDILDIGCGFGDFLCLTNLGRRIYGLDISRERVNITRDRLTNKNARIKKGYAEKIPHNDKEFDFIILQSTLHHFMYPDIVLQEVRRVLNNRGYFALVEGADDKWYRQVIHYFFQIFSKKYEASQFDHHPKRKLEQLLMRNKFKIIKKKEISIPFAWLGRIGKGGKNLWHYLVCIDKCTPKIFPWYYMFICKKDD